MNKNILISEQVDNRELTRQEELKCEIANGNQFAAGELNFRKTLTNQGFSYEQVEIAIENFFAAPF